MNQRCVLRRSLVGAMIALFPVPLAAQADTARYRVSWTAPVVDSLHPAPTLYLWELIRGDTTAKAPTVCGVGNCLGYVSTVQYAYPTATVDTIAIARPSLSDSAGPYRVAVRAIVGATPASGAFGPVIMSGPFWVRKQVRLPNAPSNLRVDTIGGSDPLPDPLPSGAPTPSVNVIFQDGFESGNLDAWDEYDAARYSITTNAARVKSGTRSLQALYSPSDAYGFIARWFMPGYDEVYLRFQVLFEEGFANLRPDGYGMHFAALNGNRIDNSRSAFGTAGDRPTGADFFYAGLDPRQARNNPALLPFAFYTYWPDQGDLYGAYMYQIAPVVDLVGGQWQEVVFHVKLNTPGQADGSQALWVDGSKQLERLSMRWRTTTDLRVNLLRFDHYMSTSPKTEHVWLDDVIVWRP